MNRRQFVAAGVGTAATITVAGCIGGESNDAAAGQAHGTWAVTDGDPAETPAIVVHADWSPGALVTQGPDRSGEPQLSTRAVQNYLDLVPIAGYPLSSLFSIPNEPDLSPYPFVADVFPAGAWGFADETDGIQTTATTFSTDAIMAFHGEYDPDVFASEYTDGLEQTAEQNEFTVYAGEGETDGQHIAFAVSSDTLALAPPTTRHADPPVDWLTTALENVNTNQGRVIDTEGGRWLFETIGSAPISYGVWGPDGWEDARGEYSSPGLEGVHSFLASLDITASDGEMGEATAEFAGIYADAEAAPSEDAVRGSLIGEAEWADSVSIDGNRVHATATVTEPVSDVVSE